MDRVVNPHSSETKDSAGGIDLVEILVTLWSRRKLILACTSVATVAGIFFALLEQPVYHSSAIIALKEEDKGNAATRALTQLGGIGGTVAGQLGIGGTSLEKIEIMVGAHELAEALITKHALLPALFPKLWNPETGTWKSSNPKKILQIQNGVDALKSNLSVSTDPRKRVLKLSVSAHNPKLAKRLVDYYLEGLNEKLRMDVLKDATANQSYLVRQLDNTLDPILREKIHGLIAYEIEKQMLMSSSAFVLLEGPVIPRNASSPNRRRIVVLSFLLGLLLSSSGIFAWRGFLRLRWALLQEKAEREKRFES